MLHTYLPHPIYQRFVTDDDFDVLIALDLINDESSQVYFAITQHGCLFDFAYEAGVMLKEFLQLDNIVTEVDWHIRDLIARVMRGEFTGSFMHMLYEGETSIATVTVLVDTRIAVPSFMLEIGLANGKGAVSDIKGYAKEFVSQNELVIKEQCTKYFNTHH